MASRDQGVRADQGVVLRTPLLPVDVLLAWAACDGLAEKRRYLAELVARPEVDEALFVASPGLHGAIERWRAAPESPAGQRVEQALVKYVARMAGRTTPFGLFSGVSTGQLGRETRIELAPRAEYRRRTRLDNDYLFLLADALAREPSVRAGLRFRPNSSIYRIAGRIRYAAAQLDGAARSYHLVSVEPAPYLDAALARAAGGARLAEIAEALVGADPEVELEEAAAYVSELVEAQLLVPELGVYVTGPEPIDGFLDQLAAAGAEEQRAVLAAVRESIAAIDRGGVGNDPARYRDIARGLEALPAAIDPARLFQVDLVVPARAVVGNSVAAEVARALAALVAIGARSDGSALDDFRRAFTERWEDREVPLAEALDEESGIGFEVSHEPGAEGSPLLAGIRFPANPASSRVAWSKAEAHLLRRLVDAAAAGQEEITLAEADLAAMKGERPLAMPDAFAVMVRLAAAPDGRTEILFEGMSGPSGARLLGRFCHASAELRGFVDAHHRAEEAARPDAVFAEIVHLNEGRIGNILCRPVLRGHEIAFLGLSGAPADRQISIDDLMVSVRDGRVVLRSRRLDREVIPRLSTAHNFRLRSLGVYRFLGALAGQGCDYAMFSWGALGGAPFTPRVRIGGAVVARATWNLDERDLAPLTKAARDSDRTAILAAVDELRRARRLPRFAALAEGDNELPIDFDNELLAAAFAGELAGERSARIVELYPAPDRLIARGPDGGHTNEVVLTFTRSRPAPPPAMRRAPAPALPRTFPPGSTWLYAKIYCGTTTADTVLRDAIGPLVRGALDAGDATHWFFLRYADPAPHVRVRLAGDPARLAAQVAPALHRAVAPLVADGSVARVQLDTYTRELERYGGDASMELVEQIFWFDSEAVLAIVEQLDGDAGADARWRLALRGIDRLLAALGLDGEGRARVVGRGREMLGGEHRASAELWRGLGERFTRERADLEVVFGGDPAREADHALEPGFTILARRDQRIAEMSADLRAAIGDRLDDIGWSLAHMHANRLLHAAQRTQEMVLYDFLRRLYAAQRARRSTT
jgi:thiopeptide-type bacteriocin biosynthesis protein